MLNQSEFKIDSKKISQCFFVTIIFSLLLRFAIGVGYYNAYDTAWYQQWAVSLPEGLFNVYSRAEAIDLDYPPIYLFFLYVTGWFFKLLGENVHSFTQMFLMKMWPILWDTALAVLIYRLFKNKNQIVAFLASMLWVVNPAAIFNCAFWGQTDSIMCFLLLISFYFLTQNKPYLAAFMMAIAGMTKFQSLFFVPVFLLELFKEYEFKKSLKGIAVATLTILAVFSPFMIGSKNPFLFFEVYLKGQGTYTQCTLNAYNVYGMLGLNFVTDKTSIIGGITYGTLSTVVLIILVLGLVAAYVFVKKLSVFVMGFLFMNSLFMFTTRMHERYQFVVMIFILAAYIIHKNKSLLYAYWLSTVMIFLNHLITMFGWNGENSIINNYYAEFMIILSGLNLFIFIVTAYICVRFIYIENKKKEEINNELLG